MRGLARHCARIVAAVVAALTMTAAVLLGSAAEASADSGDVITSFDIEYVVDPDGTLHVTETIHYQYAGFGRHGIFRDLLTRVQLDDDKDRLYEISDMVISSPTSAPTDFTVETVASSDGRTAYESYQIGSSSQTVDRSEIYVLQYSVTGALNDQPGADTELYWNATGNDWDARIDQVTVTVEVPGGARQVACWAAPSGSDEPCQSAEVVDDVAVFNHSSSSYGERWGVTIAVGMDAAQVEAAKIIVDRPTWLNQNGFTAVPMTIGAVVLAVAAFFGIKVRRQGRDKRFAGVPPGVVPDSAGRSAGKVRGPGMTKGAKVVVDDGSISAPVAFSPPKGVSPAEASYLRRPGHDPDQLAATILDLAQRGVLQVIGDDQTDSRSLKLLDRSKVEYPHERVLIDELFVDGTTVSLSRDVKPGVHPPLHLPNIEMRARLALAVKHHKWFTGAIGGTRTKLAGWASALLLGGIALLVYTFVTYSDDGTGSGLGVWAAVAILAGVGMMVISRTGSGQGRSAVGRAVMDQVEGFELYLRTAEADQLRFEEGEDIFSRYLPWAVVFDVAERWSRVCAELSRQGQIPQQPGWYSGRWDPLHSYLWVSSFNNHVGSAAAPPTPVPSASSAGNSGFSGFGGGGFSGGGGGGGGGRSW